MNYDLEDRTKKFSIEVIRLCKSLKIDLHNENIVKQLLKSSTSVGANYREANGASSKNDFRNKIHICRKEIQETEYWLDLLNEATDNLSLKELKQESHELKLIFSKISSKLKKD